MVKRVVLLIAVLGILGSGEAQTNPERDFVTSSKNAYLILPPEYICGPTIKEIQWSQDGERLAVLREYADVSPSALADLIIGKEEARGQVEPETQVIAWNTVSRKTVVLMKFKTQEGMVNQMEWMAGSSTLVLQATIQPKVEGQPTKTEVINISSSGQIHTVAQYEGTPQLELYPSPYKPTMILVDHPDRPNVQADSVPNSRRPAIIRFFGTDGVLSEPITLPAGISFPFWSNNGQAYIVTFERAPGEKKATRIYNVVNRATNKLEPCPAPPDGPTIGRDNGQKEIVLENKAPKLSDPKINVPAPTVVLTATDLKDPEPSVVSTDGSKGELSPKLNAVSYVSQGSLMIRSMVKVPLEAYRTAKLAALKTRIINQAKQVALALIMYSADEDNNYAPNTGNWQNLILPYIGDPNLLNGFVYTFAGGNASNIASPAETVLGYIEGPGGRAVAYTDGHCKWIPNP